MGPDLELAQAARLFSECRMTTMPTWKGTEDWCSREPDGSCPMAGIASGCNATRRPTEAA